MGLCTCLQVGLILRRGFLTTRRGLKREGGGSCGNRVSSRDRDWMSTFAWRAVWIRQALIIQGNVIVGMQFVGQRRAICSEL